MDFSADLNFYQESARRFSVPNDWNDVPGEASSTGLRGICSPRKAVNFF